jgi:hypothetical protein
MAKTYNTFTNVSVGSVLTASDYNDALENIGNYRVPPMCSANITASQTVNNNQNTFLRFDAAAVDTDATMLTQGTTSTTAANAGKITINTDGVYLVSVNLVVPSPNTTGVRYAIITKNGSGAPGSLTGIVNMSVPPVAVAQNHCASVALSLVATDFLQIGVINTSGVASTSYAPHQSWISVVWVGQAS